MAKGKAGAVKKARLVLHPRAARGRRECRGLRRRDRIPAIVYGRGQATVPVEADAEEVLVAIGSGARLLDISIDGAEAKALVKEVQFDPIGKHVLHLDLQRIAMDVAVEVTVPLQLRGTPIGAQEGGVLEQILREVHVKCLPGNIPDRLRADVSGLKVNDMLLAGQIPLPEGVALARDPDSVAAIVKIPLEKVEEVPVEGEAKEPEVLAGPKEKAAAEGEAAEGKEAEGKPAKAEKPEKKEKEKG